MADIKISELNAVASLNNGDLVEVSQEDSYSVTGYSSKSAKMTDIGEKVVNGIEYISELNTSNKKIIGAINEIASYTPVYGNTASGAIATFDTSLALPLQNCTIAINAVQEAGTPTPSSPKAITGFTGANIHVADDETPHVIDNVTPITWQDEAGTVYGGSLDVTSGVLTVTHGIYDLGSNNWSMISPTATIPDARFYSNAIKDYVVKPESTVVANGCCDVFTMATDRAVNTTQTTLENVLAIGSDGYIYIRNNDYPDGTAFKTAMSGHKLVYELATPVTYQLIPNSTISAIVSGGAKTTNNVFTDTNGDTSVMYACSLKDYIDSQ